MPRHRQRIRLDLTSTAPTPALGVGAQPVDLEADSWSARRWSPEQAAKLIPSCRKMPALSMRHHGRTGGGWHDLGPEIGPIRGGRDGCQTAGIGPQKTGISGTNQYVAARNRRHGRGAAGPVCAPASQIQENTFESHRQFHPQGQHHRAGWQALCGPLRRKHSSRQGHPGQPDRNAPHRRRREGVGALQDHRPGSRRPPSKTTTTTTSTKTPTASTS